MSHYVLVLLPNDCFAARSGVMLWRGAILEVLRAKFLPTGLRNFRVNKCRFFSIKAISKTHMKTDKHDNQLPPIMTYEPFANDCFERNAGGHVTERGNIRSNT